MAVAGIDLGTTGCKCTVYSDQGKYLNQCYEEYSFAPEVQSRELDAAAIWESVQHILRDATKEITDLKAVAVASMGEAAVLLDESDQPLNYPILFVDERGEEQNQQLILALGEEKLFRCTHMEPSKIYTLPKIMWLLEHKPELKEKAKRLLLMEDFIVYLLSGVAQIDRTLATRTYAYDMNTQDWNQEILNAAGIPREWMSKIVLTGAAAGPIRKELAEKLHLPKDLLIVNGAHDQPAAMIGTGAYKEGLAVDSTGTNECITGFIDGNKHPNYLLQRQVPYVPSLFPNTYSSGTFNFTGGRMLKWYRDEIAEAEAKEAAAQGKNAYDAFNEKLTDGPSGLLVLPYFLGKGTPGMNPKAKGVIAGLTPETTSIQIYQSLMEGVTFHLRTGLDFWREQGIEISSLRATGGGARSPFWLQMKADIFGIPVSTMEVEEGGNLACGMLAAVAAGIYPDVLEAEKYFIRVKKTYYPRPKMQKRYDAWYEKYKTLSALLEPMFTKEWNPE